MNKDGHPQTLVHSQPGHTNPLKSGIFSRGNRVLEPRVQEIAEEILAQPFTLPMDSIGAVEIARLIVPIDAIDDDLAERGITKGKSGEARALLDFRQRFSRRLAEWLDRYGLNPLARSAWAKTLAEGGLAADIARRRAEREAK